MSRKKWFKKIFTFVISTAIVAGSCMFMHAGSITAFAEGTATDKLELGSATKNTSGDKDI